MTSALSRRLAKMKGKTWLSYLWQSRDSISPVLCHSVRFKSPREQGGATVETESSDCQDMKGSAAIFTVESAFYQKVRWNVAMESGRVWTLRKLVSSPRMPCRSAIRTTLTVRRTSSLPIHTGESGMSTNLRTFSSSSSVFLIFFLIFASNFFVFLLRAIDGMGKLVSKKEDLRFFESDFAVKSLVCRVKEAMANFLFKIFLAVLGSFHFLFMKDGKFPRTFFFHFFFWSFLLGVATLCGVLAYAYRYLQRRQLHQDQVYDMVNQIIGTFWALMVMRHFIHCLHPFTSFSYDWLIDFFRRLLFNW